ncbi:hypothetical protein KKF84_06820, partial [Myxococcota bacterium]|nr:hypothetical protein [Myxococcota bacterium]
MKRPDPMAQRLEKKFGREFMDRLGKMGCSPSRYVYALKLTKLGLDKLVDAQYEDALFLFKKAYGIVKSPNLLFYKGMTLKGMGRPLKSREEFLRFLYYYPRWQLTKVIPGRIERAKKEIAWLESQLATLRVTTVDKGD